MSIFSIRAALKTAALTVLPCALLLATIAFAHASNAVGTYMVNKPGGQLHLLVNNKRYGNNTIVSAVCETRLQDDKLYIHAEVKVTNTATAVLHSHGVILCSILNSNGDEIKRIFLKGTAGPVTIGDNQDTKHIDGANGGVIDCSSIDCTDLIVVARMDGAETNDINDILSGRIAAQIRQIESALSQNTMEAVQKIFQQYIITLILA